jgi:hypothetical protein
MYGMDGGLGGVFDMDSVEEEHELPMTISESPNSPPLFTSLSS